MKYIINDNQIGYLVRNGRFVKALEPGRYNYLQSLGYEVHIVSAKGAVDTCGIPAGKLREDPFIAANTVEQIVPAGTFAFVIVDGIPTLSATGQTLFYWTVFNKVEIKLFTPDSPEIGSDFPRELLAVLTPSMVTRLTVPVGSVSMLYYDNRFVRELSTGVYWFWRLGVDITQKPVTVSRQLLSLPAQELLTADKVTVRVTMALEYTITRPRVYAEELEDGEGLLRLVAQLALRDYVGDMKLEELLEKRSEFGGYLLEKLNESDCAEWCEFSSAGIKDVIIPGDIRDIMNTVLLAEKQAQASVITRREEVASTRSLLNTAKLMEENPTLMRLKELEYLERICDRVDSISVAGGADLLGQLSRLCKASGD